MIYNKRNPYSLTYKNCIDAQYQWCNDLIYKNYSCKKYRGSYSDEISFSPESTESGEANESYEVVVVCIPESNNEEETIVQEVTPCDPVTLTKEDVAYPIIHTPAVETSQLLEPVNKETLREISPPQPATQTQKEDFAVPDAMHTPVAADATCTFESADEQVATVQEVTPCDPVTLTKEDIAFPIIHAPAFKISQILEPVYDEPVQDVSSSEPATQAQKEDFAVPETIYTPVSVDAACTFESVVKKEGNVQEVAPPDPVTLNHQKDDFAVSGEIYTPTVVDVASVFGSVSKQDTDAKAVSLPKSDTLSQKREVAVSDEINIPTAVSTARTFESIDKQEAAVQDGSNSESDVPSNKEEHQKHKSSKGKNKNKAEVGLHGRGLFYYQNWWYRDKVDIKVNGELITGTPIFKEHNTLRVVSDLHSYFIPIEKIDYIRSNDGFKQNC